MLTVGTLHHAFDETVEKDVVAGMESVPFVNSAEVRVRTEVDEEVGEGDEVMSVDGALVVSTSTIVGVAGTELAVKEPDAELGVSEADVDDDEEP